MCSLLRQFHVMMRGINHQNIFEQIKEDGVERIEGQRSIIQTTGKIDGCWTWTDTKTDVAALQLKMENGKLKIEN